jgi:hypothetical protein
MATATSKSAPAAPAAPLDIATAVATEEISRAQRVYVDVHKRVPCASGGFAVVQREKRIDETLGAFQLARVKIARDKSENVVRYPIQDVQEALSALTAGGVKVFA